MAAQAVRAASAPARLTKNDLEWLRVYPPLGLARVGNADPGASDYVIGPEVIGGTATKPDGTPAVHLEDFRMPKGEIKRQAARFRVYAKPKNGAVVELTAADCQINWTVAIANLKAGWYEFNQAMDLPRNLATPANRRNAQLLVRKKSRSYLDITPAPQQISGVNCPAVAFGDGTFWGNSVYLGELRTDGEGRLLFLGGMGKSASFRPGYNPVTFANNDGWHDDVSDGPVRACVTFADGATMDAEPGYVVTTPPNFAPGLIGVVTMDDAVRETFMAQGWLDKPTVTSFTNDVWPIFDRLTGLQWVDHGLFVVHGAGSPLDARDPATIARLADSSAANASWRSKVLALFRDPADDAKPLAADAMPQIFGDGVDNGQDSRFELAVTPTQYWHLKNWADGKFNSGWSGVPTTPLFDSFSPGDQIEQLERAALHDCLGGPFHPGIELTWIMRLASVWSRAYRLKVLTSNDPAQQNYGDVLTPEACMAPGGPYDGVATGALTRFMGVPWQTDGTSCNSDADYEPWSYLSMPTFWGARVPDQVLALPDYERASSLDPATRPLQLQKHFTMRADWLRDVRGQDYYSRLLNMIEHWADLGMVLPMQNPPSHLPAMTRVEQGRNTPNHPTYQHDPKFQLVTAVENLDAPPPLAQARPTVHAEIAKAVQVDQAGATRLRRRFRQDEV